MNNSNNIFYSIYQHTFPNGKIYIGATSQIPKNRWAKGKGYSKQPLMKAAIEEFGWENVRHDVLMSGLSKEEAEYFERLLITKMHANDRDIGYNIENGGNGPGKCSEETIEKMRILSTGRHHSEETKKILSEKAKKRPSQLKGRHLTEETRKRLSEAHTGFRHSEESKKKMSDARKGEKNIMFGKHHSPETIAKIKEKQRKRFQPVKCLELGISFESKRDAARTLGVNYSNLKGVCDNPNRTVKGYHIVSI